MELVSLSEAPFISWMKQGGGTVKLLYVEIR